MHRQLSAAPCSSKPVVGITPLLFFMGEEKSAHPAVSPLPFGTHESLRNSVAPNPVCLYKNHLLLGALSPHFTIAMQYFLQQVSFSDILHLKFPFSLSANVPLLQIIPLIMQFLSPRQRDLYFDETAFEVHAQGHHCIAFCGDLS